MTTQVPLQVIVCGLKSIDPPEGGVEQGVVQTCNRLSQRGFDFTIYCRSNGSSGRAFDSIKVTNVPYWRQKYLCYYTYMARVYRRILRSLDPSEAIIHVHSPCHNGLWVWLMRRRGYAVVAHSHGLEWQAAKWPRLMKPWMQFSNRLALNAASAFICVSQEELSYNKKARDTTSGQLHYIPNGLPSLSRSADGDALLDLYSMRPNEYFLFVGRLVPQKGVHTLIKAFLAMRTSKKLMLVGDGSFSASFVRRLRVECAASNRVVFAGWLPWNVACVLYRHCYAFVLPSHHEGWPNALLEAMASGAVCVVSDIPSHREIMGDAFPYIPAGDARALRDYLERLECDSAEHAANRRKVEQRVPCLSSWDESATRIADIYNSLRCI